MAWLSSCSQNAHDKNVLVRRAQSRITQATLSKSDRSAPLAGNTCIAHQVLVDTHAIGK